MALIEANVGVRSSRAVSVKVAPDLDGFDYATRCIANMFTEGYRPADPQSAALRSQKWATQKMQELYMDGRRQ